MLNFKQQKNPPEGGLWQITLKSVNLLGITAILSAAIIVLTGCPPGGNDDDGASGDVDWTSYNNDYALKITNDTSEDLVIFKSSIEKSAIVGGIKAGEQEHGIENDSAKFGTKSSDFVLYFVKTADYEAVRDNPTALRSLENTPFTRIWAFYNATGTNDYPYRISSKLQGDAKVRLQNGTTKNAELRLNGPDGETLGYAQKQSVNTIIQLVPEAYDIFPVFKKYDSIHNTVLTIKPVFNDAYSIEGLRGKPMYKTIQIKSGQETVINFADFEMDGVKFSTGAAYILIENDSPMGMKVQSGDNAISLDMDNTVLGQGEKWTFPIGANTNQQGVVGTTVSISRLAVSPTMGATQYLSENLLYGPDTDLNKLPEGKSEGDAYSTDDAQSLLSSLAIDFIYRVQVMNTGKFKWHGRQNAEALDLDDVSD